MTIYLRLAKPNSRGEKNKARGASLGNNERAIERAVNEWR